jgi:hypothetical protein
LGSHGLVVAVVDAQGFGCCPRFGVVLLAFQKFVVYRRVALVAISVEPSSDRPSAESLLGESPGA